MDNKFHNMIEEILNKQGNAENRKRTMEALIQKSPEADLPPGIKREFENLRGEDPDSDKTHRFLNNVKQSLSKKRPPFPKPGDDSNGGHKDSGNPLIRETPKWDQ